MAQDEPFDFQHSTDIDGKPVPLTLQDVVFQAIGAGSTCWESLEGTGVFQSDYAKQIGDRVVEWITTNYVHAPLVEPDIEPHIYEDIREEMGLGPLARVIDLTAEPETVILELPAARELATETYDIMTAGSEEPVRTIVVPSDPSTEELQAINGAAPMVVVPPAEVIRDEGPRVGWVQI